jgi:hypothetical protein
MKLCNQARAFRSMTIVGQPRNWRASVGTSAT